MKIHIDDTFDNEGKLKGSIYIESDALQFIIKEYTGKISTDKKTGAETDQYNTLGYYTNVKSCMKHILTMKIKESTASTLSELLEDVKRIEQYIESKVTV